MNLLIDIGNSNFKWCFSNENNIDEIKGFQYSIESLDTLLTSKLKNEKKILEINSVFVCCVASESIKEIFSDWIKSTLSKTPIFLESSKSAFGVKNAYQKAVDLGNDRWLTLVYAHNFYQTDICIIDCGTAITIDVVLKNGQHEGGLIAPGYNAQISALELKTDIIDNQIFVNQGSPLVLQNSTQQCIEQGCREMSLGLIINVVSQLKRLYGDTLDVVVTGGDNEKFTSDLPTEWHFRPDLLFKGLQFFSLRQNELS